MSEQSFSSPIGDQYKKAEIWYAKTTLVEQVKKQPDQAVEILASAVVDSYNKVVPDGGQSRLRVSRFINDTDIGETITTTMNQVEDNRMKFVQLVDSSDGSRQLKWGEGTVEGDVDTQLIDGWMFKLHSDRPQTLLYEKVNGGVNDPGDTMVLSPDVHRYTAAIQQLVEFIPLQAQ